MKRRIVGPTGPELVHWPALGLARWSGYAILLNTITFR
jgi:hypothetical protein